jgi:hypothetical protein
MPDMSGTIGSIGSAVSLANPMVGGMIQAAGALLGGINANAAGKAAMRQARMAADQDNAEAALNSMALYRDSQQQAAAGFTQAAGGGGFTGSAVQALNDFNGESLFNQRAQIYKGQTQAAAALYQGEVAKANGQNAMTSSLFNAGSSILGSYGRFRAQKAASSLGGY